MSVKAGDVVSMIDDLHTDTRYLVKKVKFDKAKIMVISPAEYVFECDICELKKESMTLDEARASWAKRHAYSY